MNTKFIWTIACMFASFNISYAQTNIFPATGNAGIGTLTPATPLQVIGSSRFGGSTNYGQFDGSGNLIFNGSGVYKVGSNKYAFQFANIPNYGLFFNSTDIRYEFRNSLATPVFYVGADSGEAVFKGGVSIGVNTAAPSNGLYVSGNTGMGIATPSARLHLAGGTNVTLGSGGTIVIGATTSTNLAMDGNEIQARNNGATSLLKINEDGGNVNFSNGGLFLQGSNDFIGIGTTAPTVRLNVDGGSDVNLTGGGYIVAGSTTSSNLAIDNNEIQARSNGVATTLFVNDNGGNVSISGGAIFVESSTDHVGLGTSLPAATLHVDDGIDATLTGGGYIIAGKTAGSNIVIDENEIMARNNGAAGTLFLNNNGGDVNMGGGDLIISSTTGNVGIKTQPLNNHTLQVGSQGDVLGIGNAETLEDFDDFTIGTNSNFITLTDDMASLGTSIRRWRQLWAIDGTINTSDERDKSNIKDLSYGLKEIMKLRSVRFNWKDKIEKGDKLGLIAQELQKVLPEVVRDYEYKTDEQTGKTEKIPSARMGVMYADIIPVLIRAIQEQQQQIEELKKLTGNVSSANAVPAVAEISTINVKLSNTGLEQNIPNPLRSNTSIRYNIPADAKNAVLLITDINGKAIKQVSVKAGSGIINIDASSLNSGTYNYALIIDGKTIESKRMVVAK